MVLSMMKLTPASISGCVLFLPHYPSSTTVSGGTVSQTNDLSGQGNNFTQATGADQPTYQTTPPYGLANTASSAISIQSTTTYALTTQTYGIKFKLDATPASGIGMCLFNLRSASGPIYSETQCLNVAGFQPYGWLANFLGSTVYRGVNVALDTNTHRIIWTYNGSGNTTNANYQFFLDGVSQTITTGSNAAQSAANPSCITSRFQSGSALSPLNGKVYTIAVYNRVLAAAEISALDQMLQAM